MQKIRSRRILLLSIYGFIIGLFYAFVIPRKENPVFFINGLFCIILSFGFFKKWKWARILGIIFSIIMILIYILLILYTFAGWNYHHGFAAIGLIFNFPLLIFCLLALDYLNNSNIKILFKNDKQEKIGAVSQRSRSQF